MKLAADGLALKSNRIANPMGRARGKLPKTSPPLASAFSAANKPKSAMLAHRTEHVLLTK